MPKKVNFAVLFVIAWVAVNACQIQRKSVPEEELYRHQGFINSENLQLTCRLSAAALTFSEADEIRENPSRYLADCASQLNRQLLNLTVYFQWLERGRCLRQAKESPRPNCLQIYLQKQDIQLLLDRFCENSPQDFKKTYSDFLMQIKLRYLERKSDGLFLTFSLQQSELGKKIATVLLPEKLVIQDNL